MFLLSGVEIILFLLKLVDLNSKFLSPLVHTHTKRLSLVDPSLNLLFRLSFYSMNRHTYFSLH